ncbi:ATP-binding protein [Saccharothrix sp. BKS2]|uniref:ATP-binding protein n=1 Tax=Saccharothrix lopnurensis TaxID=1670621 RepID=A0ABW1NY07_9PSEU
MSAGYDSAGYDTALLLIRDDRALSREQVALWLRDRLAGWPEHDVLRVGLIVVELLDNAQRHGLPRYVLELVLDRGTGTLTIRLRNRATGGAVDPVPAAGLLIVEALSEQWGVVPLAGSTTTWVKVRFDD